MYRNGMIVLAMFLILVAGFCVAAVTSSMIPLLAAFGLFGLTVWVADS